MHIPDGFVSTPINIASAAASIGVVGYALRRAGSALDQRRIPLLGVVAAFIFAAQMLNFPVVAGTSGHFVGAALAAILLGPFEAVLVMASVLVLQCLMFADGGITALGSNVFNMGIIGALFGYAVFTGLRAILPRNKSGMLAAAAVAAWASVVASALSCAVMLGASGTFPISIAMPAMGVVHALIGIGEAIMTTVAVSLVLATRPDLIYALHGRGIGAVAAPKERVASPAWGFVVAGLGVALVLGTILSPFASASPDGLDRNAINVSADKIAEAAKEEIAKPNVTSVVIEANKEVAERLEDTHSEAHGILASSAPDLSRIEVKGSDEFEIFEGKITANGEVVRQFTQAKPLWTRAPIADYDLGIRNSPVLSAAIAGLIGTLLAFGLTFFVVNAIRGRRR